MITDIPLIGTSSNRKEYLTPVVPFEKSVIGQSSKTRITINPRYKIDPEELKKYLFISGEGSISEKHPLPVVGLSRGRESGSIRKPVIIEKILADGTKYNVLGIITTKGLGLRTLASADYQDFRGSSSGVLGIDEIMIDANIGDILSEEGASVGDYLGLISVSKDDFLQHYTDPNTGGKNGEKYTERLKENWAKDDEYVNRENLHGLIRITDPLRLDYRTFGDTNLLLDSAQWIADRSFFCIEGS